MMSFNPSVNQYPILRDMLDTVPKNRRYSTSVVPISAPFDMNGVEFSLKIDTPDIGTPVHISYTRPSGDQCLINDNVQNTIVVIPKEEITSVRLPLGVGVNRVHIDSDIGNISFDIAVEHYVTWIASMGIMLNNNVLVRLQEREDMVFSPTGSLLTERWFPERDLLPRSSGMHRLCMRMVNDGYSELSGTYRGVEKIATAICNNTPVVRRVRNDLNILDYVETVYGTDEDFSGNEIHIWLPDLCTIAFLIAGKYIENFPALWLGKAYSEGFIAYDRVDTGTSHILVNNSVLKSSECNIEDALSRRGCFDRIRPFVNLVVRKQFVICAAAYGADIGVEVCNALGAVYTDCENLTMEELATDPTVVDLEDPTGDGWIGHALDGRPDYPFGGSYDTYGDVMEFMAEQCSYQRGPVATPLLLNRTDIEIDELLDISMTMSIGPSSPPTPSRSAILTPI